VDARATGPGLSAVVDATIAPPDQGGEISGTADVSLADLSLLAPFVGRPLSGGFDGTVSGSLLPSLARFDLAVDGTARDLAIGNPQVDVLLAGTGAVSARLSRAEGGAVAIQSLVADFPNLDVTASGDANALTFQASLTDAALLAPAFPGAVSATGTASFGPGGVTVEADVAGPGGLSTRVSGPLGATTDLSLTGTAPLALFNRIIDPRRLDGPADFDLRLTGPGLEFLEGTVTTAGARLADPTLGEAIRNIRGTARLSGGVATLDLVGDLALGGRLAVTGPVGITSPFLADLQIVGTDLVIRDPTLYEAFGNARLSVTGPLAGGALIAGVVDLDRVEGRVPASGVGALGDVPDVFHIEPSLPVVETLRRAGLSPTGEEISPETGARRGGGAGYGLDILLRAPSQVFLRGRGLDAELGGELRLTGTTQDVIPIGQFNLIRGRLDLLGQRFELTEGSATLQGDFNPFIRVVAETEARTGTRVAVVVEGPLASPEVSFESTPELPEDEVLAQLLFGVDIESITPLQAVRLASAVATLAGEGTGLLDDLRGGIGLADFDVTTTEGGNIALRLGQYISENVYTDVVISPEETEATINLDLTPDLTVRAGVSTRGDTSLGIFFERDY
jgi:autotransporter translocation and assembly factor TamB